MCLIKPTVSELVNCIHRGLPCCEIVCTVSNNKLSCKFYTITFMTLLCVTYALNYKPQKTSYHIPYDSRS